MPSPSPDTVGSPSGIRIPWPWSGRRRRKDEPGGSPALARGASAPGSLERGSTVSDFDPRRAPRAAFAN